VTLWHYTCKHAAARIRRKGIVLPGRLLVPENAYMWPVSWWTTMDEPDREALGLTSIALSCDRTEYRFQPRKGELVVPYLSVADDPRLAASLIPARLITALGDPEVWWVSFYAVRVIEDMSWPGSRASLCLDRPAGGDHHVRA